MTAQGEAADPGELTPDIDGNAVQPTPTCVLVQRPELDGMRAAARTARSICPWRVLGEERRHSDVSPPILSLVGRGGGPLAGVAGREERGSRELALRCRAAEQALCDQ